LRCPTNIDSAATADRLLAALGEQLSLAGHEYDLIVIGGSALLALGLVSRSTQDVDVVALAGGSGLDEALPLPEPLVTPAIGSPATSAFQRTG
jgi:hypothetical protein